VRSAHIRGENIHLKKGDKMATRKIHHSQGGDADRQPVNRNRRQFIKAGAAALVGGALSGTTFGRVARAVSAEGIAITHGTVTGDVTDSGALIWSRASDEGLMHVRFGKGESPGRGSAAWRTDVLKLDGSSDFIGRFELKGLEPDSPYWYQVIARHRGERVESDLATFHTAPAPDRPRLVRFTWGGDVGQGLANRPPFPAFAAIEAEASDFFIFNGDTIYGDGTTPIGPGATTVPEFWAKYKENREDLLFRSLARNTPMIINWDDHEVDNDYRGLDPELPEGRLGVGRQAFFDYWPVRTSPTRTWRSLRWGREVEIFVLDNRQFADPLDKPDGAEKTMLGSEQLEWLLNGVLDSDATWKVLVTSCPLSILRSVNPPQDDWVAYEHELAILLETWRSDGVANVVWLTADVHWAQAIEYPSYAMWEFVGCPIGANPRAVGMPLSPTFGPIERFLGLNQRSYGSVIVDPAAGTMTVDLKLQDGTLRHRTVIRAA
jgi:alkaline phosphatase D